METLLEASVNADSNMSKEKVHRCRENAFTAEYRIGHKMYVIDSRIRI